ncbi:MAG: hypothetical protein DRJ68_00720 [Thermoprotei archaeon]|nr:MAG: hypothetical protein DRJ62_01755 [Thermoprotei archaeon]RLF22950.1 MAG: hypothetical protein DRJ68_00720 [Thermoprotei archaeon]
MAVRLKLRVKVGGLAREVVALLNSGYEAPSPQLLIPTWLARDLNLWPPQDAREDVYEAAGGPLKVWILPKSARVQVVADVESREVDVDVVISMAVDEPLISDALAGALEVAVEDFARGLWRFRWEPKDKVRETERA